MDWLAGWLLSKRLGIPNWMFVVGGAMAVVVTLGAIMGPPPRTGAGRDGGTDAGDPAATSAATPSATTADLGRAVTVPIRDLESSKYDGKVVCTCGYVQSSGHSPGRAVNGSTTRVLHNIYVSAVPPTDEGVGTTVVCASFDVPLPKVTDGQKICVQGTRESAFVGNGTGKGTACTVVPTCL